jgi:hypothetical protein
VERVGLFLHWGKAASSDGFRDTLQRLMRGERIGFATEKFNERYAEPSSDLSSS